MLQILFIIALAFLIYEFTHDDEDQYQNNMQEMCFKNWREFNKCFPSKLYICSNCNSLTEDKFTCKICGWRADGLLKTWDKGFKYTILETNETKEIFKPIELLKQ